LKSFDFTIDDRFFICDGVDLGETAEVTHTIATRKKVVDGTGMKLFNDQMQLEAVDGPVEICQNLLRLKDGSIKISPMCVKRIA
jgi:hypothetical protein